MQLWVGLGNPGSAYARHRHNVGFMAVEAVASRHRFPAWRSKFRGQFSDGAIGGARILLLQPQTFMNRSGESVAEAVRFYKLPLDRVVVFHDELDLAAGKLRLKLGGGVAGHNGLRSIDACLGSREFRRVRIGIGHPGHKDRVTGHVLGDFAKADQPWLDRLLDALAEAAPHLADGDDSGFMNRVALLTQPPKQKPAANHRPSEAPAVDASD